MDARNAVLHQLAGAQARFESEEREARSDGDLVVADGAHRFYVWIAKAYLAEFDDKATPEPIMAACGACRLDRCDGCHFCRAKVLLA